MAPLSTTSTPSLLLLILDIHPLSWSLLNTPPPPVEHTSALLNKAPLAPLPITEFVNILLVFLNAHLASRWGNQVVVFAASVGRSKLLYPIPGETGSPSANTYQPFQSLDARLEQSLKGMVKEEEEKLELNGAHGLNEQPAVVSALTKALCYINRVLPSSTSTTDSDTNTTQNKIEPRIMIVNATPASSSSSADSTDGVAVPDAQAKGGGGGEMRGGYVGLMNCVFAAQKAKVPIDVLTLPPLSGGTGPPIFLQQAAYLTEGVYWRWNGRGGLLQYLHSIYLAPPALRHKPFAVPPQDAVDFRAVCFCHHDVVDVGFVCSVCLSIFCKPLPVCLMCKTKFPFKALPTLKALAADITPIPIPNTIPPPSTKKGHGHADGADARSGHKAKRKDVIEIE